MEIEKPLFSKVSFSLPFMDGKGIEFYFGINITTRGFDEEMSNMCDCLM